MLLSPRTPDLCLQDNASPKNASSITIRPIEKSMEVYMAEVRRLFSHELEPSHLYDLSTRLQAEFREKLQSSDISMLPSYHHTLPTGQEQGTYLALDVGGSNFRLALIELTGSEATSDHDLMRVRHSLCFPIDASVRALHGREFFEWMADRIEETLQSDEHKSIQTASPDKPLLMGMAWSFPIEQTSARSGHLLTMGKGFSATVGVQGLDLCDLLMAPCKARGLNVKLQSLVNDSSASFLSQAYRETTTRMSLILGTGTNSSIFLPVSAVGPRKLGTRPRSWHDAAQHVVVNTELSMHGEHVWPLTRWDTVLNAAHELPGFQPFEHLVGGRYLGEIARLIILEAITHSSFLDGAVPAGLEVPYSLDSPVLGMIESDASPALSRSIAAFCAVYRPARAPTPPEMHAVRDIAALVSTRAAAYEAAAVHALWELRCGAERGLTTGDQRRVTIACNGSVLEKYPRFRERCQAHLDALTAISLGGEARNGEARPVVELRMAHESSMFGAAVAAACCAE